MTEPTIEQANEVLATFATTRLEKRVTGGRVYLYTVPKEPHTKRHGPRRVRVYNHSGSLMEYNHLDMGGTGAMACGQIVRWLRGQTRLPRCTWEYWTSETIRLGNAETLQLLDRYGYFDPEKTKCVRCGATDYRPDWWDLDGLTGPCCYMMRCEPLEVAR